MLLQSISHDKLALLILVIGALILGEIIDFFAKPRLGFRSIRKLALRFLPLLLLSSLLLVMTGSVSVALLLTGALLLVLVIGSNLKLRLLNEPLVFTDLTLLAAFVKHPRFYLQAIPVFVRWLSLSALVLLILMLIWASNGQIIIRIEGAVLAILSAVSLKLILEAQSDPGLFPPDLWADMQRDGLLPTLLLYVRRWKNLPPLSARPLPQIGLEAVGQAPDIVIIVQCESFAEPSVLNPQWETLPTLARARDEAIQWGELHPSGFGAYTMRSEYGVLCGDENEALSYRLFDPFLTAAQTPSHGLANQLSLLYEKRLFLHPYDLNFYNRRELMPQLGFTSLIGGEAFTEQDKIGDYVSDASLAHYLLQTVQKHDRFLAYCVTIENHGPWKDGRLGLVKGSDAWREHAQHSDEMLSNLCDGLKASGKDALLVFFGDHRPALGPLPPQPHVSRTTPYVMLRFNEGKSVKLPSSQENVPLTMAELHHTIIRTIMNK
ncbi:sulfatase-like hydrolase/transferase [Aristophania vespae]|uniref:Sulfatase-like hydrolase/transferase n=1 Tax=Aristophania vespae TaxID=2697033 RepID=A0A6P1N9B1_9PROT|nr:LTA synthase family protein [Aristophania vespae]QHI95135.1 sulfatase-like hydrolase/transferase [Aristophania vespae]